MLLYHPQRLPPICSLIQLLLDFTYITTNPPHFYNSRWLTEVRPVALIADYTYAYFPHSDWVRDLNNYLQGIGQAANLVWAFTESGQTHTAVHYATAKCEFTFALPVSTRTNPDFSPHSERRADRSRTRNYQEGRKVHGGAGVYDQYWPLNLRMQLNARLPKYVFQPINFRSETYSTCRMLIVSSRIVPSLRFPPQVRLYQ